METRCTDLVKAALKGYVEKDRPAIERLLADDYRFTSPLDNALDRTTYVSRCWPNSATMESFECVHAVDFGDRAFVVYEALTSSGKRIRNTELHTAREGKLVATEVYFGWNLPHPAPSGGFVERAAADA